MVWRAGWSSTGAAGAAGAAGTAGAAGVLESLMLKAAGAAGTLESLVLEAAGATAGLSLTVAVLEAAGLETLYWRQRRQRDQQQGRCWR